MGMLCDECEKDLGLERLGCHVVEAALVRGPGHLSRRCGQGPQAYPLQNRDRSIFHSNWQRRRWAIRLEVVSCPAVSAVTLRIFAGC